MSPLEFISPQSIARLEDGSFVAERRSKPDITLADRRDTLSPLAVTKRSIRYEPKVFENRRHDVLEAVQALNDAQKKILLVAGDQGTGKTSLIRAAIEMMDGNRQQVLWFDVNRYTDFEEVIRFLIDYIEYLAGAFGPQESMNPPADPEQSPYQRLDALLNQISRLPLVIVIDNVEFLVDPTLRFRSVPFKEILNFLLSFANVKIILSGQRLPYTDMGGNRQAVGEIKLGGLPDEAVLNLLAKGDPPPTADEIRRLLYLTSGYPWLIKVSYHLQQKAGYRYGDLLDAYAQDDDPLPTEAVTRLILDRLSNNEIRVFYLMAMLRHPVSLKTLMALCRHCYPDQPAADLRAAIGGLDQSHIRPVYKVMYPPQEVLAHIRQKREGDPAQEGRFSPWFELYMAVKNHLRRHMPEFERQRLHQGVYRFYMAEKELEADKRISGLKTTALLSESRFHGEQGGSGAAVSPGDLSPPDLPASPPPLSRAYTDQPDTGRVGEKRYFLDAYRQLEPFGNLTAGEPETPPDLLELSDEERQILFEPATASGEPEKEAAQEPEKKAETLPPTSGIERRQDLRALTGDLLKEDALADQDDPDQDDEALEIRRNLARAVANRNKPALVDYLLALAEYRLNRGGMEGAKACLEKAAQVETDFSNLQQAEQHRLRGRIAQQVFQHNEAIAHFTQALTILVEAEEPEKTAPPSQVRLFQTHQALGEILAYRKQYGEALQHYRRALDICRDTGEPERGTDLLFLIAGIYDDLNQPDDAIAHYRQALEATLDNAPEKRAAILANLAALHAETGQPERAADLYQQALTHDREAGNSEGQLKTLAALGDLSVQAGTFEQADAFYQQALALAERENLPLWQARLYMKLGNLFAEQTRWQQALTCYHKARNTGRADLSQDSLAWIEERIREVTHALNQ